MAPRRSRRIASQEPEITPGSYTTIPVPSKRASAAAWDVNCAIARILDGDRKYIRFLTNDKRKAIVDGIADRNRILESRIGELEHEVTETRSERDEAIARLSKKRSLRDVAHQERLQQVILERRAASASQEPQEPSTELSRPSLPPPPSSPPRAEQQEPEQEQALAIITSDASPPADATEQQEQVPDVTMTEPTPSPLAPAPMLASTPIPKWRKLITNAAGYFSPFGRRTTRSERTPSTEPQRPPTLIEPPSAPLGELTPESRKRSAADDEDENTTQRPQKTQRTEETASSEETQRAQQSHSTEETPRAHKTPREKTPHRFLGPSALKPGHPTSLSTITENTELRSSTVDTSSVMDATPSKPPASSFRRSLSQVRAARTSSLGFTTPRPQPPQRKWDWERRRQIASATSIPRPQPSETNADRRYEKLERMKELEEELRRLKEDEEIKEMESHRRKRVKVDSLAYIPHNKPGDSSSTFRVPDIDSDDEMEVDLSVPERTNVFEEATKIADVQQEEQHVEQETSVQEQYEQDVQEEEIIHTTQWAFPDVGPRLPEQDISPEEEERCRAIFAAGFEAWCVETGTIY